MSSRILHISTVHPWSDPRILRREIATLAGRGYDVHWMVAFDDDANADSDHGGVQDGIPPGVTLHQLRAHGRLGRSAEVLRLVRSVDADLIHLHDPELLVIVEALRRATGAAIVYDKHEYYRGRAGAKSMILRWAERSLIPGVDGLIVVEHAGDATDPDKPDTDDLVLSDVPVITLPNYPLFAPGSQPLAPEIRDLSTTPIRLVYTGVVAAERGLWTMLDVVEEIASRSRDVRLTIAGLCHRPEERERFDHTVRLRGLAQHIHRIGWDSFAPWDILFREAQAADVGFMLMDRDYRSWSNIPTKFYEYMYAGLPFVCTDYPNWKSFVMTHDCGVVVDCRDTSAVADEVVGLADSSIRRARMSAAARTAAAGFSWVVVEDRLGSLYEELGVYADAARTTRSA